jgi:hypothetical protein
LLIRHVQNTLVFLLQLIETLLRTLLLLRLRCSLAEHFVKQTHDFSLSWNCFVGFSNASGVAL